MFEGIDDRLKDLIPSLKTEINENERNMLKSDVLFGDEFVVDDSRLRFFASRIDAESDVVRREELALLLS